MSDGPSETRKLDLGNAAALTVLVVSIVVAVFLLYYLIDIVILLFLGIVVAAAVQPWHERLCRLGMSKGLAVLLIYLLFAAALILIGLLVVPVLIEEMSKFAAGFPEDYAATRATLQASPTGLLQLIGERLPPFAALTQSLSGFSATFFAGALGFTTGTVTFVASLVTVLVVGFYWTMTRMRPRQNTTPATSLVRPNGRAPGTPAVTVVEKMAPSAIKAPAKTAKVKSGQNGRRHLRAPTSAARVAMSAGSKASKKGWK
jgi:predicted PurR-regulated permease PerM